MTLGHFELGFPFVLNPFYPDDLDLGSVYPQNRRKSDGLAAIHHGYPDCHRHFLDY